MNQGQNNQNSQNGGQNSGNNNVNNAQKPNHTPNANSEAPIDLNKYQKSAIALAIIVVILVIIRVSVGGSGDSNTASSTGMTSSSTMAMGMNGTNSNCGFTVTSMKSGDSVAFPLTVSGLIDNSNKSAKCKWQMFEGQAGSAQLYYNYKNSGWMKISSPAPIVVDNWMSDKANFTAKFAFMNKGDSLPAGTPMKVVFTEENPSGMTSGMGGVDTLELPFMIR